MPLRIFRSRNVSGANLIQMLMVAGLFGMFFLGSLYLQRVLGYDALEIGLAFLPVAVLIGALSLGFSARLNMRFGARATLIPGLVADRRRAPAVRAGPRRRLLRRPTSCRRWSCFGLGAGLSFPSLAMLAMSGATRSDSGLASGLVNTSLQVGGALGLAVLATLSTTRTANLLASGESTASALTGGYRLAFLIGAGLVIAAIGVAVAVLRPETAEVEVLAEQPEVDVSQREPSYSEAA